jgi:MFS family permease
MILREQQKWLVVAAVFVTNFFVVGSGSCITGVFLTPLVRQFGWTRTRASSLAMMVALTSAASGPVVGWLLDVVDARRVMSAGVAVTAAALLLAGRANSFGTIAAAHIIMGLGMALAAMIPAALVVSNWFDTGRGVALGIAMAGMSLGGSVLASVVSYLIVNHGWRWSYSVLAGPLLILVLPMVLLTIRTRPGKAATGDALRAPEAEGLTTGEALLSRSFWLLSFVYFSYLSAVNVGVVHMVPYLISLRLSAQGAALVFSIALFCSTLAKPVMGVLADRLSARMALALAVISLSCGFLLLTQAVHPLAIWPLVVLYGIGVGAPVALVPMLAAESFGLRHFGTLAGLIGVFGMVGSATGPMVAGRIFDVTGAYIPAFLSYAALLVIAAVAPFGCVAFSATTVRTLPPLAHAALS